MKKEEKSNLIILLLIIIIIVLVIIIAALIFFAVKPPLTGKASISKDSDNKNPIIRKDYSNIDSESKINEKTNVLRVTEVIDGDTVELSNGERVRLLGINTDEKGQKCYFEAKIRLEELVLEKEVVLEKDSDDRDMYGRILRYILVDNKNVNILLVREGLANVYVAGSNKKYVSELEKAERDAREESGCLWQKSFSCRDCIGIAYFHWNAEGNDCNNPNDEYVKFSNNCKQECDMTSWTVKDEATHIYTFPDFILQGNSKVTLRSGKGVDTIEELFWKNHGNSASCPAIWNNEGGDVLYLRDKSGKLAVEYKW